MIFKIKNGLLPDYLSNEIHYVHNSTSNRNLRNAQDFRLPNFKSDITRNSIFYEGLKLFNNLPNELKETMSLLTFKYKCKEHIMATFPTS